MKVVVYGNQGNIGLRVSRWLRAKGIEVTLVMPNSKAHSRSLPEWEDEKFREKYPYWIKLDKGFPILRRVYPSMTALKSAKDSDVVITTGPQVVEALRIGKPTIFIATGSDLSRLPFETETMKKRLVSYLYKKRIKNVNIILAGRPFQAHNASLLGVSDRFQPFSFPVDVDKINNKYDKEYFDVIRERYATQHVVFFSPSRKNIDPTKPDYKGSEKMLQAFRQFLDMNAEPEVLLILGMHGHHVSHVEDMVRSLGLEAFCEYVDHMPLPKLHAYMKLPNGVVLDQFGPNLEPVIGGVGREALSLGSVLITGTSTDDHFFQHVYGENCPAFPACSEEEICRRMNEIYHMRQQELDIIRRKSQEWSYEYLDWENRIDDLIYMMRYIAENSYKSSKE